MTYCAALRLQDGIIFASDTRTNAGVDHISTYRKLYSYSVETERFITLQTAGNLATSQAVFTKLQHAIDHKLEPNLHTAATLFDAAQLVGECLREVTTHAQTIAADNSSSTYDSTFMLGGQIKDQPTELYLIYSQGNFIRATVDTPYFQLGESKYGKPILDRSIRYQSPLNEAIKAILLSFDSTIRSNLSVGMPIDLVIYRNNALSMPHGLRIDSDDPYYQSLCHQWSEGLKAILKDMPETPEAYWQ